MPKGNGVMDMQNVKNAVIESAVLDIGDRGFLTAFITLDYGGTGQVFGHYALYLPKTFKHHNLNSVAGHFIYRVMMVAGVDKWHELVGRTVRVSASHSGISAIGHIVKDDWFTPSEEFNNE